MRYYFCYYEEIKSPFLSFLYTFLSLLMICCLGPIIWVCHLEYHGGVLWKIKEGKNLASFSMFISMKQGNILYFVTALSEDELIH